MDDADKIIDAMKTSRDMPGETLPEVAEICGIDVAKKLLKHYRGCQLSIPSITPESCKPFIINYVEENEGVNKLMIIRNLTKITGKSEITVRRIINDLLETNSFNKKNQEKFTRRATSRLESGLFE